MNKNLFYLILLIILILPALFLLVKNPMYYSQDSQYHIERIREFDSSIHSGQFPPRLAPNILSQIGYPLFVVNYQLPYYLAEIPMYITDNAQFSFKFVLAVTYILSSILTFLLFRTFSSNIASLTGAVVYSYLPYRFANIYTRGSLGESVAICFIPAVLYSLNLIAKKNKFAVPALALSVFGLITSHTIVFLIFVPFFILYPIIILRFSSRNVLGTLVATFLGILLSSFQLIPSILERKYMVFDKVLTTAYNGHFLSPLQLFRIPIGDTHIGTSLQLGIASTLILTVVLILFVKKYDLKILFFLTFFFSSILLISNYSLPLWNNIFLLRYILYPWRFLSLALISTSFMSVLIVDKVKYKKILAIVIITVAIFTSRHYFLKPSQIEPTLINDNLTTENEFNTIWVNTQTFIDKPLVTSQQKANISIIQNKPFFLSFDVKTELQNTLTLRKIYFPNWQVKMSGKNLPLSEVNGLITFQIPSGTHRVETFYRSDYITNFSNFLSLASLILIGLLIFLPS